MKVWYVVIILVLACTTITIGKALHEDKYVESKQVDNKEGPYSKRGIPLLEDTDNSFNSHQKYKRRRSPFGLVYKDGKPIGILEPISRVYEFQNFQDDLVLKNNYNKREMDPNTAEDTYVKRDIDKFENDNVLRSFRMNPHPASANDPTLSKSEKKRNVESITQRGKIKSDSKLSAIENNLKEIISDLNTISADDEESEIDKREVVVEDEDLDNGVNKIGLTKETHGMQYEPKTLNSDVTMKSKKSVAKPSEEVISDDEKKVADYRGQGENFIRQKRQQSSSSKPEVNDIVKGLEASGDLTVSGNKSPLASASAPVESDSKKGKSYDFEKREKQASDDTDYEKRLQRNIQNKISEIKAQVKREIQALGTNKKSIPTQNLKSGVNKDSDSELKEVAQDKSINVHDSGIRQKRNLLEQESEELDIGQNTEADSLTKHIRQKRSMDDDLNDSKIDTTDLNNDVLSPALARTKRKDDESGFGCKEASEPNPDAVITPVVASQGSKLVRATRDLTHIVNAAGKMDAEKLEKLVKESATLTESIKSKRAANFPVHGSHINAELHDGEDPDSAKATRVEKMVNVNRQSATLTGGSNTMNVELNGGPDVAVLKRSLRSKQNTDKKKTFRNSESKESKAKIEEIEAISDNSPAISGNSDEGKFKAFGPDPKLTQKPGEDEKVEHADGSETKLEDGDAKALLEKEEKQDQMLEASKSVGRSETEEYRSSEDGDLNKRASNQETKVRQERESQPGISLDDMQAMENENRMRKRRRRRYVADYDDYNPREKRDYDMPSALQFRNYRGDEDEADDESDEFDDDNFDDRTANLVRKRAAQRGTYEEADNDYVQIASNRVNKRNTNARDFVAQMNDDAYDTSNYLYDSNGRPLNRNKRQIVDKVSDSNLAALHGGGPMMNHLAAIRGRNTALDAEPGEPSNRLAKNCRSGPIKSDQSMSGLSDSDIFGALPQSYEGELTRFKRVKRDDPTG